jgi:PAS domain S-box-containing protein
VGQRLSQWQPDLGRGWLARLAQVARTGTATRFTQPVPALGCWLEVHAFSTGTADSRQVALLYTDVSEQKRQAQRQQFRLHLSDALRPLGDAVAIQQVASALTQTFFEADRCYYGEIADGQCVIRRDAAATGVSSVAGQYDLRAMPLFGAALAAGQPLVVEDVQTTALVDDAFRQLCRQLQVVSFINVPVRKNGQAVGIFCLTQGTPRRWAPEEVALVVEVAERTWGAVKRARAEEHLHESEERFRQLVEAYAQAVWEADPRGLIVQDSPSWRAYTGQTEAEWLGDGWLDAIHPDDRAYAERQWHEAIATGRNVDTEFRLRRAAGGYCWTNVRATPLSDTAGRVHKWVGMNIDIDQQKRASDHLRRSQERLRLALEAAELATWDWNLTTNQVRWNARHFTLFGMVPSPKPVTPADFERHVHPGDRVAVLARLQAAAAANTVFEAEFRIITDQGDTRWMSGHGQPTSTAPDGRIRWMSGVMLDITARKHTEQQQLDLAAALERKVARRTQALQASKDLQEAVFNTVRHAITVLTAVRDARGQIIDFAFLLSNGVADRHMGVATAGRTLRTVLPGYADEANFRLMVQVVETGQPTDAVQHFAHGAHPLHLHTQYNKLGDGVVLVHEDITARLAAEQAIQDSRDLLQSVYDTSLIGMAVLHAERDAHGTIEDFTFVSVNQELARATGRPDLVGRRYAQEFPGSVPSGSLALMARAVETGAPQQHEHYYPYEGINRWYASMYVQLDGGVVATTLDITERKQAEQALRNNLELLEQAEQVAQLGSWAYDLATGVLRWSEGMGRLFGLPPGAPVQPGIYLAYAVAADRPVAERLVRALTDARADFAETLRLQVGPEEKTVRIKAVVQRDADGQPARVLGVDLDISQVQRLEADKLRQQQALFEAVQVAEEAERRRMSESLHNGIGQILYATKLQLDLLPDRPASAPRQQAVRLLGEAIRQTRALSHELTPATLEEFGLEKTLQSICATLNTPGLRWHRHLVLESATTLPMPLQLAVYRLAQELAQNVLKHAQATEATLEVEELPGWVVLRVEDNGRGFDPARTSDGLGLRSLRGRVALLGGQVYLTTAPGEGTQFQLHIPLAS